MSIGAYMLTSSEAQKIGLWMYNLIYTQMKEEIPDSAEFKCFFLKALFEHPFDVAAADLAAHRARETLKDEFIAKMLQG